MKDKTQKDKERWFFKIFKLLELEKTTPHGRTNLAGVLIIAFFTFCACIGNTMAIIINAGTNMFKTWVLKKDINYPSESVSFLQCIIPLLIAFTLCLLYLCWHEWAKSKISKQQNKDDDD